MPPTGFSSQEQSKKLTPNQLEFLNKLEKQIQDDLKEIRTYERMDLSAGVAISSADSSRMDEAVIPGLTVNISRGGCLVETSTPPQAGDHYRVQIMGIGGGPISSFARCVRVVLKADEVFEAGFQFFSPLTSPIP
jgi:hypothetical protein